MTRLQIAGGRRWLLWAEQVVDYFPLAGTDWKLHSEYVEMGVYDVRNRRYAERLAEPRLDNFADEPPLSPEEEEAVSASGPSQGQLF